jgi:hypothetical protein
MTRRRGRSNRRFHQAVMRSISDRSKSHMGPYGVTAGQDLADAMARYEAELARRRWGLTAQDDTEKNDPAT